MNLASLQDAPPGIRVAESSIAAPLLTLIVFLAIGGVTKFAPVMQAGWAVVYLWAFVWFGISPRRTMSIIFDYWPVFILPLSALLSGLWSYDAGGTLRTATQFLFSTLVAARIAAVLPPTRAIRCVFVATLAGFCLSMAAFVVPQLQPVFASNGAFVGSFVQKTVAGIALTLFALSLYARGAMRGLRVFSLLLVAAITPFILMTKSVSALVLMGSLGLIVMQGALRKLSATGRFARIFVVFFFVFMSLVIVWLDSFDLSSFFLEIAGKNSSLTGRTDIWELGFEIAREHPVLGVGYAGFWGNPAFVEDWSYIHATVDPRLKGFHNLYLEGLVTMGPIGLGLIVFIYYWTLLRALFWFVNSGTIEASFWLAIVVSGILLSFVDNTFFSEHEFFHIAATLVFIFASRRWKTNRRQLPTAKNMGVFLLVQPIDGAAKSET